MGKNGSVDTKEIEQLMKNIEAMKEDASEFVKSCTNEIAARLLRKVIKRTPVGRKPRFDGVETTEITGKNGKKRNVRTKKKKAHDEMLKTHWSGYVGGNLRRSWGMRLVREKGYNYTITVENPAKYASYVEHGHRQTPGRYVPALGKTLKVAWVPGKHMLSASVDEIEASKYKIIDRRVQDFIEEHMNV